MARRRSGLGNKPAFLALLEDYNFRPAVEYVDLIKDGKVCQLCDSYSGKPGRIPVQAYFSYIRLPLPPQLKKSRAQEFCPACAGTGRLFLDAREHADALNKILAFCYPKLSAIKMEQKKKLVLVARLHADHDSPELEKLRQEAADRAIEAEAQELLDNRDDEDDMRSGHDD